MFRLDNKTAVVIGGAGGIGEACATALARQGAKVVVADMNLERAPYNINVNAIGPAVVIRR